MAEIVIKVAQKDKLEEANQFYLSADVTSKECKDLACKEFGVPPTGCTLFRVNGFDEPVFPLRKDKQPLTKSHIASGDLLILMNDADILPEDRLILHIHMTVSGLPDDSQYIDKIDVFKEFTLRDLKEAILLMP